MELVNAEELKYQLNYEDLIKYTNNFSEENYVGTFHWGKVYRGKIEHSTHETQHVLVKIWEEETRRNYRRGDNESRLMNEIRLLRYEKLKSHPGMIKLYGYCWDNDRLGIVYNIKPFDTVHNLVTKDSFTWLQRIKVALRFAHLLKFLHKGDPAYKPILVRNITASNIILDEEYNPRLFDFGKISGGIFPDRTIYQEKCRLNTGNWEMPDEYAFGCLLLILITKRVIIINESYWLDQWAKDNYKGSKSDYPSEILLSSFVDPSLEMDPDFSYADGRKITKLAMCCLHWEFSPSMKQVVKKLLKLQIVRKNTKFLGLDSVLQDGGDN